MLIIINIYFIYFRVTFGDINEFCECTLSKDEIIKGHTGCNDRCLNRLLKVEW